VVAARAERSQVEARGYRIHALHTGAGHPLVLLHGLSGSAGWWRHNVPAFAAHYRTHTPDLVGFGRSRGRVAQPSIAEMADVVAAWLDAQHIERAHLIGHSMGGQIAIHLAAQYPVRIDKLVLVAAAGIPRKLSMTAAARFIAELVPPRRWGSPTFLPTIAADALRAGPRALLRATNYILHDDVRPLLSRLTMPTLLVWGRHDPMTPLAQGEEMARGIPGARLIVFEDAAHMPMVDRAQRFNQEVLQFLRDA
jgi:pimeloyl-ACP methyl ester carboxylesterase